MLLPKCPACVAAILSAWAGPGVVMSVAGNLRAFLIATFLVTLVLVLRGGRGRGQKLESSYTCGVIGIGGAAG